MRPTASEKIGRGKTRRLNTPLRSLSIVEGALMDVLTTLLPLVCVLLICFALYFSVQQVSQHMIQLSEEFKRPQTEQIIDIDAIKQEIFAVVEDTVANMQPPNAMDHLLGALAQFAQVKLMKMAGIDGFQANDLASLVGLNDSQEEVYDEAV